jgi:hypothetical protein
MFFEIEPNSIECVTPFKCDIYIDADYKATITVAGSDLAFPPLTVFTKTMTFHELMENPPSKFVAPVQYNDNELILRQVMKVLQKNGILGTIEVGSLKKA